MPAQKVPQSIVTLESAQHRNVVSSLCCNCSKAKAGTCGRTRFNREAAAASAHNNEVAVTVDKAAIAARLAL